MFNNVLMGLLIMCQSSDFPSPIPDPPDNIRHVMYHLLLDALFFKAC